MFSVLPPNSLVACSLLVGLVYMAPVQAQDTTRYTLVSGGMTKGFQKTWRNADGSFGEWYQYNDRGRGDSLLSRYRLNDQGVPVFIEISGVDYMKNTVSENFQMENGIARWKNGAEDDQKPVSGVAYYSSLKANVGPFFKAMRKNGGQINLLPFGEARMEQLQLHPVKKGGVETKLALVSVSGLGMTPSYSWLDEDGSEFASLSDWFSLIREGYESYIPELLAIQKKIASSYLNNIARNNRKPFTSLLIQRISLFDARKAQLIPDVDVLVRNGKIEQVSPGKRIQVKAERVIDGSGKTMLPGLWDMHVHMGDLDGILHIANGVTHVRDMGNDSSLLTRIRDIRQGTIVGPDVDIRSGFIDGAGPLAAPTGALINTLDEGVKAIREYATAGYQQIKLYSSIKPEWVKPLAAEAHRHGMRVAGHIPAFMTAEQAIAAGYDEITHLNMLALNFFGDTVDTRSPNRFRLPAAKTASLDLEGSAMKSFISLLKSKKIAVDPTVGVFESLFTARDGKMEERYNSIVHRMPATLQRNIRAGGGGLPVPDGMDDTYHQSFEAFLKITRLLYENSVTIVAGTDGLSGFDLHRELELYVKAGIPAGKVLQIATYGTARYVGKDKQLGSIEPARGADFIIVEGNPVTNISDIRNTRWVVKNGFIYDAEKLFEAISIKGK